MPAAVTIFGKELSFVFSTFLSPLGVSAVASNTDRSVGACCFNSSACFLKSNVFMAATDESLNADLLAGLHRFAASYRTSLINASLVDFIFTVCLIAVALSPLLSAAVALAHVPDGTLAKGSLVSTCNAHINNQELLLARRCFHIIIILQL